jgi:hypothetical protein
MLNERPECNAVTSNTGKLKAEKNGWRNRMDQPALTEKGRRVASRVTRARERGSERAARRGTERPGLRRIVDG